MKNRFRKERDSANEQSSASSIDTMFLYNKIRNCCSNALRLLDGSKLDRVS
jgi:hypothetical protein